MRTISTHALEKREERRTNCSHLVVRPVKMAEQETHQMVEQAKRRATKIRHKAVAGGNFDRLFELREITIGSSR